MRATVNRKIVGSNPTRVFFALLAQSVEHQTFNLRVAGSSPARGLWSLNQTLNDINPGVYLVSTRDCPYKVVRYNEHHLSHHGGVV